MGADLLFAMILRDFGSGIDEELRSRILKKELTVVTVCKYVL